MWSQVVLNGQALPIKSFQEYCELYLGDKLTGGPREYLRVNERWEVCVAPTDGQFQQVRAQRKRLAVPMLASWTCSTQHMHGAPAGHDMMDVPSQLVANTDAAALTPAFAA